jgi:hypothetical protein
MVDLLVRGVPEELVASYQWDADTRNISRNEAIVEGLKRSVPRASHAALSMQRWREFMSNHQDLADPEVMDAAWR